MLHFALPPQHDKSPYQPKQFGNIERILRNNLLYIGNLHALHAWYSHLRPLLMDATAPHTQTCLDGARKQITRMVTERTKRLNQLAQKVLTSLNLYPPEDATIAQVQNCFILKWPSCQAALPLPEDNPNTDCIQAFIEQITPYNTMTYTENIQALPPSTKKDISTWLQSIVAPFETLAKDIIHE
jgi:UDP-N-acetylglucosamine/UDP-N-acetylgalactosamine diphosphorylase